MQHLRASKTVPRRFVSTRTAAGRTRTGAGREGAGIGVGAGGKGGSRWTRGPGETSGHVSAVTRRIAGGMSSNLRLSVCLSLRLSISGGGRELPRWISSVSGLNLTRGVPNWPAGRPHRAAAAQPPPSQEDPGSQHVDLCLDASNIASFFQDDFPESESPNAVLQTCFGPTWESLSEIKFLRLFTAYDLVQQVHYISF